MDSSLGNLAKERNKEAPLVLSKMVSIFFLQREGDRLLEYLSLTFDWYFNGEKRNVLRKM
jgi:hypothetical protein